jgi:WD40 repeat protein
VFALRAAESRLDAKRATSWSDASMRWALLLVASTTACSSGRKGVPAPEPAPGTKASPPALATSSAKHVVASAPASTASTAPLQEASPTPDMDGAAWSPDKKLLVTCGEDRRTVHLWEGATRKHLRQLGEHGSINSLLFSPDGKLVFVGTEVSPPAIYDLSKEPPTVSWVDLAAGIVPNTDTGASNLAVSSDGTWLAGTCDTAHVCVWTVKTGAARIWRRKPPATGPMADIGALRFEPKGPRLIVTLSGVENGGTVTLDVKTMKPLP